MLDSQANVLCPACKLWNTGHGANMMREAVSLMGGYGVTEDCPGFLGQKWMDAQLEATYEGPEAVQRLQLSITMTNELFLAQYKQWMDEMCRIASERPGTGACTLATAMKLWLWTLQAPADRHRRRRRQALSQEPPERDLPAGRRPMLAAGRAAVHPGRDRTGAEGHGQPGAGRAVCRASSTSSPTCATCRAPARRAKWAASAPNWCTATTVTPRGTPSSCHACYSAEELTSLEGIIPGIDGSARACADVTEANEAHPLKAGPCVTFTGLETFVRLRAKLDGCLTGARLAKDRAAEALTKVMIPEALDYPV